MAEEKKKQEELQEEQLDKVNGGNKNQKKPFGVPWAHSGSFDKLIITTMAEDKNKLKEEQLQDEQLNDANGGGTSSRFPVIQPQK